MNHQRKANSPRWHGRVPGSVSLDSRLSDRAVRLYSLLSAYVFHGTTTSIGQRLLAERLGWSQSKVNRAMAELIACDHVVPTEVGVGSRAIYHLTSPVFGQKQGKEKIVVSAPSGGKRLASLREGAA